MSACGEPCTPPLWAGRWALEQSLLWRAREGPGCQHPAAIGLPSKSLLHFPDSWPCHLRIPPPAAWSSARAVVAVAAPPWRCPALAPTPPRPAPAPRPARDPCPAMSPLASTTAAPGTVSPLCMPPLAAHPAAVVHAAAAHPPHLVAALEQAAAWPSHRNLPTSCLPGLPALITPHLTPPALALPAPQTPATTAA